MTEFPIPVPTASRARWRCIPTAASGLSKPAPTRWAALLRDGTIVEFAIRTPNASARGVAVSADGDLWFTENFANKIGRMDKAGSMIAEYDIPTPASGARCIVAIV